MDDDLIEEKNFLEVELPTKHMFGWWTRFVFDFSGSA